MSVPAVVLLKQRLDDTAHVRSFQAGPIQKCRTLLPRQVKSFTEQLLRGLLRVLHGAEENALLMHETSLHSTTGIPSPASAETHGKEKQKFRYEKILAFSFYRVFLMSRSCAKSSIEFS